SNVGGTFCWRNSTLCHPGKLLSPRQRDRSWVGQPGGMLDTVRNALVAFGQTFRTAVIARLQSGLRGSLSHFAPIAVQGLHRERPNVQLLYPFASSADVHIKAGSSQGGILRDSSNINTQRTVRRGPSGPADIVWRG